MGSVDSKPKRTTVANATREIKSLHKQYNKLVEERFNSNNDQAFAAEITTINKKIWLLRSDLESLQEWGELVPTSPTAAQVWDLWFDLYLALHPIRAEIEGDQGNLNVQLGYLRQMTTDQLEQRREALQDELQLGELQSDELEHAQVELERIMRLIRQRRDERRG